MVLWAKKGNETDEILIQRDGGARHVSNGNSDDTLIDALFSRDNSSLIGAMESVYCKKIQIQLNTLHRRFLEPFHEIY